MIKKFDYQGEKFTVNMTTGTVRKNGKILLGERALKKKLKQMAIEADFKWRD